MPLTGRSCALVVSLQHLLPSRAHRHPFCSGASGTPGLCRLLLRRLLLRRLLLRRLLRQMLLYRLLRLGGLLVMPPPATNRARLRRLGLRRLLLRRRLMRRRLLLLCRCLQC
jgi:hypothetical protein